MHGASFLLARGKLRSRRQPQSGRSRKLDCAHRQFQKCRDQKKAKDKRAMKAMHQLTGVTMHESSRRLHDEGGSSWSVQRERYLREEITEYRHKLERH
jgi:hypothetical protein